MISMSSSCITYGRGTSPSPLRLSLLPFALSYSSSSFVHSSKLAKPKISRRDLFPRCFAAKERSTSYENPEIYDIAFGFRDFEAEAAFLLETYQELSTDGSPLRTVLDVGCGPARHSVLLAQSTGCACVCIDNSDSMLEYAAKRAQDAGVPDKLRFEQVDMTSPEGYMRSLANEAGPNCIISPDSVDLAIIMLGTMGHCIDNEAGIRCFRNIAEVVKPGGLLVVELAHPNELWSGSFLDGSFVECWEVDEYGHAEFAEEHDGGDEHELSEGAAEEEDEPSIEHEREIESSKTRALLEEANGADFLQNDDAFGQGKRVLVEYGRDGDAFDTHTQVLHRTVGFSFFDADGELVESRVDVVQQRQYTLQEVDLLGRLTGWELVRAHGDLDVQTAVENEEAYRLVTVLRKT